MDVDPPLPQQPFGLGVFQRRQPSEPEWTP